MRKKHQKEEDFIMAIFLFQINLSAHHTITFLLKNYYYVFV